MTGCSSRSTCPIAARFAPSGAPRPRRLQALNLFNSPFIVEQAQRLAARAEREAGDDVGRQIERVFALTLARAPDAIMSVPHCVEVARAARPGGRLPRALQLQRIPVSGVNSHAQPQRFVAAQPPQVPVRRGRRGRRHRAVATARSRRSAGGGKAGALSPGNRPRAALRPQGRRSSRPRPSNCSSSTVPGRSATWIPGTTSPSCFGRTVAILPMPRRSRSWARSASWPNRAGNSSRADSPARCFRSCFPHLAELADDICFIHSLTARNSAHTQAENFLSTGFAFEGYPSLGAWTNYALGSPSEDLPAFVAIADPRGRTDAGANNWGSGFLPAAFQGASFNAGQPPRNLTPPPTISPSSDAAARDLLSRLNDEHLARFPGDTQLAARIASYELAGSSMTDAGRTKPSASDCASGPWTLGGSTSRGRELRLDRRLFRGIS